MVSLTGKRIWVAGHRGMAGAALVRRLRDLDCKLLTVERDVVDLTNQQAVRDWVRTERPDVIFLAAARVGGIQMNRLYPATLLLDNVLIVANVVSAALAAGCRDLLYLASSAAYPLHAPQPLAETTLLDGPPDPSHAGYAAAKRAGIELCRQAGREHGVAYRAVLPTNLYGPGDDFWSAGNHVVPALIRRFHDAAEQRAASIDIWGTGRARRDLLYVDDLADACIGFIERSDTAIINIGSGGDVSIAELAHVIAELVGFTGTIRFDVTKPDGAMRRVLSTDRLDSVWRKPRTDLREGLVATYRWFLENRSRPRARLGMPSHISAIAED